MSNDKKQQDFAARLQRIAQEQEERPVAPTRPERKPEFDLQPRKDEVRLRNGVIWAFIIAAAGAGAYYGYGAIPQDLKDTVAGLMGGDDEEVEVASAEPAPEEVAVPVETETMSDEGPIFASPRVAHATEADVTLDDIATSVSLPTSDTQIGSIRQFGNNTSCTLRAPAEGETLVNVRLENGLMAAPIAAFSNNTLAAYLTDAVARVTKEGQTLDLNTIIDGDLRSVDVFLTDTRAPQYLVLQNMGPGVVWNVQAAPGVEVAHIALIAEAPSGVITPASTTTVEALLVPDFVAEDSLEGDCVVRPWRMPQAGWIGVQKAAVDDTAAGAEMATYQAGFDAFNRWYRGALGSDANTNVTAPRDAAHVLVGPLPSTLLAYRGLEGQEIAFMRTDNVFAGAAAGRTAEIINSKESLLTAAVGGDLSRLDPATVGTATVDAPDGTERDATFAMDTINARRTITVSEILTRNDLFSADEQRPAEVLVPLYAEARAPALLAPYCEEVVGTLAAACNVLRTDVTETDDGKLEFTGRLGFAPSVDLGDPSTVANGTLFSATVPLPFEGDLLPAYDRPTRVAMMEQAQAVCDTLRARYGNCVLTNLRFVVTELWFTDLERLPPGTNPQRVEGRAQFTVYADETLLTRDAFWGEVELLVTAE
ncbi:MAG: hypothetical protein AAFU41_01180 [Pseudomonadota bacterium]